MNSVKTHNRELFSVILYCTHTPMEINDGIKTKRNIFSLLQGVDVEESTFYNGGLKTSYQQFLIFLSLMFCIL